MYTPRTGVHSAMYEKMNTNLPKDVMAFRDQPFDDGPASFIPHQEVRAYLEKYAAPVKPYIKHGQTVRHVHRASEPDCWHVAVSDAADEDAPSLTNYEFDALFVCTGHYHSPRMPPFAKNLRKPYIHSHDYRTPKAFEGGTVVVVGAGPSGMDICLQLARTAKKVFLSHSRANQLATELPANVQQCQRTIDADDESLLLADGTRLADFSHVVFCTGYVFSLPFMEASHLNGVSGDFKDRKPLVSVPNGDYVSPLFADMLHVDYPDSLFFIGLNVTVVPFILFDHQVQLAIALMTNTAKPVTDEERRACEANRLKELEIQGLPRRFFHLLADRQWDHFRYLSELANVKHTLKPVIRHMYDDVYQQRRVNCMGYKQFRYTVVDDDNFVRENLTDIEVE